MLYNNENIKFNCELNDEFLVEQKITDDDKSIGFGIAAAIDNENEFRYLYITWIFYEEQDKDDLVMFIQYREDDLLLSLADGWYEEILTKVIVVGKEIELEDIGHLF